MSTSESFKLPGLNGLRAISILLVIIHHLNLNYHIFDSLMAYWFLRPLLLFLEDGHMGVNVFFVISGFLITTLLLREENQNGKISLFNFYARRTLRIFPAYYFLLSVYAILHLADVIKISYPSWFTAITYTKYFNWNLDWFTSHAWSLSIEEHFYILYPLIFSFAPQIRKKFVIAIILLVPLIRVFVNVHPVSWINELTLFLRIDSIATGCLFAFYKDDIIKKIGSRWNQVALISFGLLFMLRYFNPVAQFLHLGFIFIPLGLTHGSVANFLIAIIMMYSVFGTAGIYHRFLNLRAISFIGILSYSLYLWQQIFTCGNVVWITSFPQNLLFIFCMALFSYYVIESPFLRLKNKIQKLKS